MVRVGYAAVMYIPPSEFDSREWGGMNLSRIKHTLQLPKNKLN